ncbi:MAG: hypothetical protein ACETWM_19770 [Candidatus Lokiarchaeia archaeon]
MARAAILTGTAGGIIGSITGGWGIVWAIINIIYIWEFFSYSLDLALYSLTVGVYASSLLSQPISFTLFSAFSIVLALLLVVSCTLLGVGYYGLYKIGGGAMGIVGLIFSIIGSVAGGLFILLGNIITEIKVISFIFVPGFIFESVLGQIPYVIYTPSFFYIWIGFIIIAITFIIIAVVSIALRDTTARPRASLTAGILSIVGSCLFFPYILITPDPINGTLHIPMIGANMALTGFTLIFVAFILWAAVFYSSIKIKSH